MTRSALLVTLLAAAATPPAQAAEPDLALVGRDGERSPEPSRSYAGQIAAADLAAGALALGSMGVLVAPAATVYVGTPVVIHLLHHNPGRAALSAGLRIALPLAGGLLAGRLGCSPPDDCTGRQAAGALAGAVTASIIDAAWLTREATPPPATARSASAGGSPRETEPAPPRLAAAPMVLPGGGGLMLGGAF